MCILNSELQKSNFRNSSVELLKIIAMFFIVVSHIAQTLSSLHPELPYPSECFFDAAHTARDLQHFVILLFRHFGAFGNIVFFICSAWFLCDSKKVRTERIFQILADVWILSVSSFIVVPVVGLRIPKKEIFHLLFPTTFSINWYATCYICFLGVCPFLNIVIEKLSGRNLLKACFVLSFVYCGICCVASGFYFYTELVLFITIYFCVAYIKKYLPEKTEDVRFNSAVFVISLILLFVLILATNLLGYKISFFERNALRWARNNNPLIILAAFSMFNLFRRKIFYSKFVNYISSLTLFIYLIHEGDILRSYFRPWVWFKLYENFGYSNMVLLALIFSLALFFASVLISVFYKVTLFRVSKRISKMLHLFSRKLFSKIENRICKDN